MLFKSLLVFKFKEHSNFSGIHVVLQLLHIIL